MDKVDMMKKGALVSQAPYHAHQITELNDEDRAVLEHEAKHKWSQPYMLYFLTVMCSLGAATQGMDETCNAGAVAYWPDQLGVTGLPNATYIEGLIVGAPYLACAVLGCWLNEPLNKYFARRGTIWISCFVAAFASIWEAFTYSRWQLFAARFVLGLGIGAKSSTIPVYAAECSPAPIRGISQNGLRPCFPLTSLRCLGHAMAGMDRFRNYVRKHHGRCLLLATRGCCLALHASLQLRSTRLCNGASLLLS